MRLRVRHLCLALIPVAVVLALAVGDDTDRRYCTGCGLIRLSRFRTFLGLAGPRTTGYRETEFHRLLLTTGPIECSHRWQAFYWNHHHVRSGEIHIPLILVDSGPYADIVHRIARLEDPDRRFAILTSLDLTELLEPHMADDEPAFLALGSVRDAVGEQEWWMKHQHRFVGRLPPDPVLRRTRPSAGR